MRLSRYLHSWLKVGKNGLPATNLGKIAQNDKLARFQTRGWPDKFWGNETTIFLNDEVASSEVDDSHMGFKREEKSAKTAIWFESLLGSEIPTKSHHKKDSMMLMRLRVGAWLLEAP
jgi:hypothetical protein